ncbi:MAG: dihydrofolate reductase family protein [Halomonas sp.]|nr:dihydrofolate reductase family protein [Halomonas sp.]MCC5883912.1 dihydrofolate reductase family protein [Halomonas sp.]
MKKLIAFEFISLDGFMAGPPGQEMDFVVSGFNSEMEHDLADQYHALDAFVMGKTTFQSLADYWPTPAAESEVLYETMNSMEKLVCSTTLTELTWSNSRTLGPDAASEIESLKHTPGKDLMIIGSASLVQAFSRKNLVDEFRFFIFPVFLGAGKPLFDMNSSALPLRLFQTRRFATGVLRADYGRT